ncbi:hypothetical protein [Limosilactobacillus antri]|jgi:hypothetical protein|uniref:hypothetical protein n=1 Tax=Limosilactobacillus antri TaxID=227943 RepID=UPI001F55EE68|nr:hypothetical protein [Limosilactobacillus antri]
MRRNIFLVFIGLETLAVGIYLMLQRNALLDDQNDRIIHMIHEMGNYEWSAMLMGLGLVALVIGILNTNRYNIQLILLTLLGALWCAYSMFFTLNDLHFGKPFQLGTLLSIFNFILILFDAYFGRRG